MKTDILNRMQEIVDGCMGEEIPACQATCPMHTDAKRYIKLIADGNGKEAIKVIRDKLFLPGTLGRICAHPCEGKCKWNEGHSPMAIASLKRYAADNFDLEENWDLSIKEENGKSVAIIGCGPSGMQAALDLRREGFSVHVYEKLMVRGGMLRVGIPSYRLPRNVLEREITYLDKLGIVFHMGVEIGKDIEFKEIVDNYDAAVIAIGRHQGRVDRSLDNYDNPSIKSAQAFLHEVSMTNDCRNIHGKALVIGGGDVAMDCCRSALRCKNVELVYSACLEDSFDSMASSNHEIKGALAEGVKFNHARAISKIHVEDGKIKGVSLKKCTSMLDSEGRFNPSYDETDLTYLEVDSIIFAIGQGVDGAKFDSEAKRRGNGTFECDKETLQSTSNPKIFACGDASGESVIAIQAMATGRRAAESVRRYLNNLDLKADRELKDTWTYETKLDMPTSWDEVDGVRLDMAELDPRIRINSFDEVALGYTKEEAIKEASRCRQCECKLCMKECIMLNEFASCPKELFRSYLEKGEANMDRMIAYSCNECRQCTLKCPKSYELRDIFTGLKSEYATNNNGIVPLDILKESDKGQIKECDSEFCTAVGGKEAPTKEIKRKTKYVFVPGCTVPAYSPEGCEKVLKHLRECLGSENVGAMLQCCGKVTKFIGEDKLFEERNKKAIDILDSMGAEVIITVCPSCYKVFKATAKNQRVISYWDLMHNLIGIPEEAKGIGKNSDVVFNIHDSCVTRDEITHHESVRWMLDEMGYKWEEIERNGRNTRCCGVGGMVCSSRPDLYMKVYERRAKDFNSDNIITYCGSCRGTMQAAGKDALHILDLLFGPTYYSSMRRLRGYKNEGEMWSNRKETKYRFNNINN